MPWEGSDLWLATLDADGRPRGTRHVAGGEGESIFQPAWSPAGELHFVSDRSGWWNLYRERAGRIVPLLPDGGRVRRAAMGVRHDDLRLRRRRRDRLPLRAGRPLAPRADRRRRRASRRSPRPTARCATCTSGTASPPASPLPSARARRWCASISRSRTLLGAAPGERRASTTRPTSRSPSRSSSRPRAGAPRTPSSMRRATAGFVGPSRRTRPPLLVISHGGPTGATSAALEPKLQYWTSAASPWSTSTTAAARATAAPTASGSTAPGASSTSTTSSTRRATWSRAATSTRSAWRSAARAPAATRRWPRSTFRDVFQAGASHYGISDLEALARDTHKFESRYLDRLIGPYPRPGDLYRERSPIQLRRAALERR